MRKGAVILAAAVAMGVAARAQAYVDLAPTLAKVVSDSRRVVVVEVVRVAEDRRGVVLREVSVAKEQASASAPASASASAPAPESAGKHVIAWSEGVPAQILDWAEPGSRAVLFVSNTTGMLCLGQAWYQATRSGPTTAAWRLGAARPDLPLAYHGSVSRLANAVETMVAGRDVVITVVRYGVENEGASFDLALNRAALPGLVKVQRIRARMKMPAVVMAASANPAYLVGGGRADVSDLPALRKGLAAGDPATRAEAAEEIGWLGGRGAEAEGGLAALLADDSQKVRLAAAAALLRVAPSGRDAGRALGVLSGALEAPSPATRREAARAAGLVGPAGKPLAGRLAVLIKDDTARFAALQAIATLGPAASEAVSAVAPLLDDPSLAIDAADALGRIGAAARPACARLAKMLESADAATRWAAVRAMSQIGGEESRPAVDFILKNLQGASEVDGYNMMIYLALLGPVASDAAPTLRKTWIKNPVLPTATLWAIEPEKNFPWQNNRGFGGNFGGEGGPDFAKFIYEAYVNELGERLKPAATVLARKIMEGSAGDVPQWGYKILAADVEGALAVFVPALTSEQLATRQRAVVALGYMGASAAAAKGDVEAALKAAGSERERKLIAWCLREMARSDLGTTDERR